MTQPEYLAVIKQIQTLRRSIEVTSANISHAPIFLAHSKYNQLLWDEAVSCTDTTIDQNFDIDFADFVDKLLDNELDVVLKCFVRLDNMIKAMQPNLND